MNEQISRAGWIAFDDVEIDIAGHRLLVGGVETALERKSFAVLLLLAQQPGRVFTRDEILDAVWGHRHVTPGVLNRTMTLLRQALGESGEDSRYLHTVHGVGYRFDAQLHAREPVASVAAPPRPAESVRAGLSAPVETPSPQATPGPATTARSRRRVALLAFAVVLAAAASYLVVGLRGERQVAPAAPALIVLPLHPVGSAHDEDVLAEGLSEELITRLARIDGLRVISSTSATRAQDERLEPAQLAQRLHVTHALEGSLRESGEQCASTCA
jgi:DNA-binding winged helix-turn-helix (wHTH) protein/TolB-like protein